MDGQLWMEVERNEMNWHDLQYLPNKQAASAAFSHIRNLKYNTNKSIKGDKPCLPISHIYCENEKEIEQINLVNKLLI